MNKHSYFKTHSSALQPVMKQQAFHDL